MATSRCRSTATATHTGTATWATRSGSAANHVPSSPWRRGMARMAHHPDRQHRGGRRDPEQLEPFVVLRPAQPQDQRHDRGDRGRRRRASSRPSGAAGRRPGCRSPRRRRPRSGGSSASRPCAGRAPPARPTRPSASGVTSRWPSGAIRKTMIWAVNAGQPTNGPAQAATWAQYAEPGPSPSSTQTLYASAASVTDSRLAAESSQPKRCRRMTRDDQRPHQRVAHPRQRARAASRGRPTSPR